MADGRIERARFCSQCGQPVVVADAAFCKECGAALAVTEWFKHSVSWRPLTAFMLSAIPGLGHLYKRQTRRGIIWYIVVVLTYAAAPPMGLMLHMLCGFNAAFGGAIREDVLSRASRRLRSNGFSASADWRL